MLSYRWIVLIALFAAGCAAAPIQEMSDARQAIQAARDAGAERHAADRLNRADKLLQEAEQELDNGGYKAARDHARAARDEAIKARKEVVGGGAETP